MSGVSFYIYNEVAFWILDLVHPVTAAVGNSIKRIVLILASIIVFQTQVSELGWLGSAMAIGGSFAYALSQQWSHAAGSTILPVSSQVSSSSATSLANLSTGTGEQLPPSEKYSL
jgi:solute carrier family 35 protein E1